MAYHEPWRTATDNKTGKARKYLGRCGWSRTVADYGYTELMSVERSMPILIVDDYKTMLRIIRNLLQQLNFNNIDEATDGGMALERMREKHYGLVISDWNMQPMTGLELLREVRGDSSLKATPFIMVTAESKTENVIAAKEAGVSNYIVKPFNAETLRAKIASVLGPM